MNDYSGSMNFFQEQLDRENINFDITDYAGCTKRELQGIVDNLINNNFKEC